MTARCTSTTTCQGQVARPCSLALTVLGTSLAAGYGMQPSHCCCWTSSAESHQCGRSEEAGRRGRSGTRSLWALCAEPRQGSPRTSCLGRQAQPG